MPTVFDRLLGTRLGAAVAALVAGERGIVAGLAGGTIRHIPLAGAIEPCTKVNGQIYRLAETLAQ